MSKMKVDKDILLYRICIKAKQKSRPSYKIQHPAEGICEELHVDLMGPITPTGWNGYKYSLTITNSYSRSRWVENMHEKREAGPRLKQFVTFIEKQTGKSVKRLRLDEGREFGVRDLESWTKDKGSQLSLLYLPVNENILVSALAYPGFHIRRTLHQLSHQVYLIRRI